MKQPDGLLYIGFSTDLRKRIKTHQYKKKILGLVYYEAYQDKSDAIERERQLKNYKSAYGHLKKRIKGSIESI